MSQFDGADLPPIALQAPIVLNPASSSCNAAVIWLHGFGDGPQNWVDSFKPLRTSWASWPPFMQCKWLHLNAPLMAQPCYDGVLIPAWAQLGKTTCLQVVDICTEYRSTAGLFLSAVAAVRMELEQLLKAGVAPGRIVIGGAGQGAAVAMHVVLSFDVPLAGCISFSSWMTPDVGKMLRSGKPPDTPFLICHGTDDDVVSCDCACVAKDALESAGVRVQFLTYPGLGHGVCTDQLQAMASFLRSCLSCGDDAPPIDWQVVQSSDESESEKDESEDDTEATYVCKEALEKLLLEVRSGQSLHRSSLESLKAIDDLPDEQELVPLRVGLIEEIIDSLETVGNEKAIVDNFLRSADMAVSSSEDTVLLAREWRSYVKSQTAEAS